MDVVEVYTPVNVLQEVSTGGISVVDTSLQASQAIEVLTGSTLVQELNTSFSVIDVIEAGPTGIQGAKGDLGPKGEPGNTPTTFTMDMPSTVWTISHGYSYKPVVVVYDTTGHEVEVDIDSSVAGVTYINSYYPLSGKAVYI